MDQVLERDRLFGGKRDGRSVLAAGPYCASCLHAQKETMPSLGSHFLLVETTSTSLRENAFFHAGGELLQGSRGEDYGPAVRHGRDLRADPARAATVLRRVRAFPGAQLSRICGILRILGDRETFSRTEKRISATEQFTGSEELIVYGSRR